MLLKHGGFIERSTSLLLMGMKVKVYNSQV